MVEIKVNDKIYEVYARDEHSLKKEPHIRDKATGEVPQNQKTILCDYLISIGRLETKIKLNTHGYVYEVLNSKINKELEKAKDYMLTTIKDEKGEELVELSFENVAKVEAMIQNDSAYRKSSDKNAGPDKNYKGSTAYWMTQLKNMIIEHLPVSSSYEKILEGAIEAVDRENSTHLNADKCGEDCGRKEIRDRLLYIINNKEEEFIKSLKRPIQTDFFLFKEIARKTKTPRGRNNPSFASKFCHYACFYLFEGMPEQDNYSIYDKVLKDALPKYINHYLKTENINLDDYPIYYNTIGEIIKESGSGISRNGFDHLLWYYFKGR
jgi:hypothetical protein